MFSKLYAIRTERTNFIVAHIALVHFNLRTIKRIDKIMDEYFPSCYVSILNDNLYTDTDLIQSRLPLIHDFAESECIVIRF